MNSRKSLDEANSKIAFLPIKPKYADRILSGEKEFEFRRAAISSELTHVIIYASSPQKCIVAIVKVDGGHVADPDTTWKKTKKSAGITRDEFDDYFSGTEKAYCIALNMESLVRLKHTVKPAEIRPGFRVPQSFCYVDSAFLQDVVLKSGGIQAIL